MRPHIIQTLTEIAGDIFAGPRPADPEDELYPQPRTTDVTLAASGGWSQLTSLR